MNAFFAPLCMAEQNLSDVSLFPISFTKHMVFTCIATVFFVLQFLRTKRWYQLVLAVAVPISLLIYAAPENTVLFYTVGILEAVLLCGALALSIVQSRLEKKKESAKDGKASAEEEATPEEEEAASEEEETAPAEEEQTADNAEESADAEEA